ncbi:hypothetical protein AABB24_006359 [Solanum stoloniferum]|uniref:HAT C-terminal dimerisation domain-containing protein n=1 Tax=Solanum stoloniferum TaxID=62892 RepID=A0ABD2V290_9SOLN
MSASPSNKRLKNKRGHDEVGSDNESCDSNAVQFKIDPKTGEQFKYCQKRDSWELAKFIIAESLYSKSFTDSLEKYIQIFYYPAEYSEEIDRAELVKLLCVESILYTTNFRNSLTIYIRNAHFPAYKPIPRGVIISEIRKQFYKYRSHIIENFKSLSSSVALCIDIVGTECSGIDIVCFTAYWIDDNFIMQKRILEYQTGLTVEFRNVSTVIEMMAKLMYRYSINDKLFSVNSYFKEKISENTNESAVREVNHKCVICACHILNSIVRDGITHFEPEIKKIRRAMGYIRCCSYRNTEFSKRCLADKHIMKSQIPDIPTRWNTTYDMLVRALEQKAILTEAYNEAIVADAAVDDDNEINDEDYETKSIDDENDLTDINWNICEELVDCLQKFHSAITHFSGSYYPTCNSVLVYLNDISSLFLKYKDNPFFSEFLPDMKAEFIKRFIPVHPIYLLGALLDPMIKLEHIETSLKCLYQNLDLNYSEKDLSSHKDDLLKLANKIYSGYDAVAVEPKQAPIARSSSASSSSSSKRFPGCEFWKQQVVMSHESKRSANSNELSVYLEQQYDIDESDFDLLAWWKGNTKKFPLLSRMARDVLAVPVSTIPLDKVFKQDEVQIWEKENLLGDESVERIECLKDWIRAERRMQGLEEIDKDFLEGFEMDFEEKCNMTDEIREFTEAEVKEHLAKLH